MNYSMNCSMISYNPNGERRVKVVKKRQKSRWHRLCSKEVTLSLLTIGTLLYTFKSKF